LNGFEWIYVSKFRYLDLDITRIGPANIDPSMKEEDTLQLLNKEENEEDPWDALTDDGKINFLFFSPNRKNEN